MTDIITLPDPALPVANFPPPLAPLGYPERLFKVSPLRYHEGKYHGSMQTGAWLERQPGSASSGGIGVLMDDTLGAAAMVGRPENTWAVTTELALNFIHPLTSDGSLITATAQCLGSDHEGGIAQGHAFDAEGRLLAHGTTRAKFTPGTPDPVKRQTAAPPVNATASSMSELLSPSKSSTLVNTTLPANPHFINPHGSVHGGILLAMVEFAASRFMASFSSGLGLSSLQLTYVRPAIGDLTISLAERHRGRSLVALEAVVTGGSGKPCVLATAIYRPQGR